MDVLLKIVFTKDKLVIQAFNNFGVVLYIDITLHFESYFYY